MLDNIEVALLTKVNRLAERFGLKSYDFQARLVPDPEHETYALTFSEPVTDDPEKRERYSRMLSLLGVASDRREGDYVQLIDRMDDALKRLPNARTIPVRRSPVESHAKEFNGVGSR